MTIPAAQSRRIAHLEHDRHGTITVWIRGGEGIRASKTVVMHGGRERALQIARGIAGDDAIIFESLARGTP